MGAENFGFAPKFPKIGGLSAQNLAFLGRQLIKTVIWQFLDNQIFGQEG